MSPRSLSPSSGTGASGQQLAGTEAGIEVLRHLAVIIELRESPFQHIDVLG